MSAAHSLLQQELPDGGVFLFIWRYLLVWSKDLSVISLSHPSDFSISPIVFENVQEAMACPTVIVPHVLDTGRYHLLFYRELLREAEDREGKR